MSLLGRYSLNGYRNPHYKTETVWRLQVHDRSPYTNKTVNIGTGSIEELRYAVTYSLNDIDAIAKTKSTPLAVPQSQNTWSKMQPGEACGSISNNDDHAAQLTFINKVDGESQLNTIVINSATAAR